MAPLPTASELEADYQLARRLETEFAADAQSHDRLLRALGGVAAAIVHAASNGANVPDDEAGWAVQLLIESAVHFGSRHIAYELSFSPDGADRQAALALPLIFVPLDDEEADGTDEVVAVFREALCAGAGSPSVEVRHYAAEGLRILNGLACHSLPGGRCRHEVLWAAIEAAARTTTLGEYATDGTRQIEPIVGDIAAALANSTDDKLMLSHIAPAAIAAVDAAQAATCISDRAKDLRDVLLGGAARAACHWADHHYEWRNEYQAAFASAVLRWSTADDPEAVVRVATALTSSPDALGDYLHSLMIVATHEPELVPTLAHVWSQLMAIGLDTVVNAPDRRRPRHAEKLIRSLVPSPSTLVYIENIADVLHAASARWFPVVAVAEHIEQWLDYARGEMFAVDALVGFLRAQPISTQVDPGLNWIHDLVVDDDGSALTCGFRLVSWLTELRDARLANVTAISSYRAIVDALVLGNYQGARALQERDE